MRFIDDKGRVFGKINFIDLLAILLLIFCLIFPVIYGIKKLTKDPNLEKTRAQTWFREAKCEYCGFAINKELSYGDSPSEEYIKIKCKRCGKAQEINYGSGKKNPCKEIQPEGTLRHP